MVNQPSAAASLQVRCAGGNNASRTAFVNETISRPPLASTRCWWCRSDLLWDCGRADEAIHRDPALAGPSRGCVKAFRNPHMEASANCQQRHGAHSVMNLPSISGPINSRVGSHTGVGGLTRTKPERHSNSLLPAGRR